MTTAVENHELQRRHEAAREIAWQAAERGMVHYRSRDTLAVQHKSDDLTDVVSIADRDLEDFIRAELSRRFPEDGLLGEERGVEGLGARYLWVIDPIDGTSPFINGLHNWCVSIGLLREGEPVAGAIADPNHGELFHARLGAGAYCNDSRLSVHGASQVRDGLMGVGTTHRPGKAQFMPFMQQLLDGGGMFFRNGSGALMTAYVAAGRLIGYFETRLHSWDCAAGLVLVREAGGRHSDFFRGDGLLEGNPLLVAAPGVYEQLAAMAGKAFLDGDDRGSPTVG